MAKPSFSFGSVYKLFDTTKEGRGVVYAVGAQNMNTGFKRKKSTKTAGMAIQSALDSSRPRKV